MTKHVSIEFPAVSATAAVDDPEEESKRQRRAEKFGTNRIAAVASSSQPAPDGGERGRFGGQGRGSGGRRGRGRGRRGGGAPVPGMTVGMDDFSQEEADKRSARAQRFGTASDEPDALAGLRVRVAPLTEEQLTLKKRAEKFGLQCTPADTNLADADLLEELKEVGPMIDRRPDTIHVYGVDIMSTRDIKQYFRDYEPANVEWINDSSCNVCFENTLRACQAIVGLGAALPADEAPDQGGLSVTDVPIAQAAYMWHRSQEPFVKGEVKVTLLFRIASVLDVKDPTAKERSRYLWKTHHEPRGEGAPKRRRVDDDGDVVMGEEVDGEGRARNRKGKRQKGRPHVTSFLDDSDYREPVSAQDLQATYEADSSYQGLFASNAVDMEDVE